MADIRNMERFVASKWSFRYFDEAFRPTRISFGDLDGIVERKGQFLVLETKGEGVPVPEGQAGMFTRMVETGRFTVVILWGTPPDNVTAWRVWPGNREVATRERVRSFVEEWRQWAEAS